MTQAQPLNQQQQYSSPSPNCPKTLKVHHLKSLTIAPPLSPPWSSWRRCEIYRWKLKLNALAIQAGSGCNDYNGDDDDGHNGGDNDWDSGDDADGGGVNEAVVILMVW